MTPTNDRQKVLDFTQPYNYTPAVVVVLADDDSVNDLTTDLDGKKIGVCSGCTYEQFLNKDLVIDGYDVRLRHRRRRGLRLRHRHDRAPGPRQRPRRRGDHLATTAQGYIDAGNPVKIVGDPIFYEPLSVGFDKSSDPSSDVASSRRWTPSSGTCTTTAR